MRNVILAMGYCENEQARVRDEWKDYELTIDFVDSLSNAAPKLRQTEYVGVSICAKELSHASIELLCSIQPLPIVLLADKYDPAYVECVKSCVSQHMRTEEKDSLLKKCDYISRYLAMSRHEPLTILSAKYVCLCLEYRSVEIKKQTIDLTAKEFDVAALLMSHPKRVFTYEVIFDIVWHEDYTYCSRKAVNNHISNIRKKFQAVSEASDHIKSVHSIGYKFDVD